MNRLSTLRMLLAAVALAAASVAGAQVSSPTPEDAPGAPGATLPATAQPGPTPEDAPGAPAATRAVSAADAPAIDERHCLRETGSLIRQSRRARRNAGPCLPVPGRAYTAEDLRSTGQIDIAQALRQLDPSIH